MAEQAAQIEGRQDYLQAVEKLLGLARHKIQLYSVVLDPALYASSSTIDLWRRWATASSRAQAQIIIHDARKAVSEGNSLINLGQHLTSSFALRGTSAQHMPSGDVLIVDEHHLLKRSQVDSRTALLHLDDPLAAREASKRFNTLWDESQPSADLRRQLL